MSKLPSDLTSTESSEFRYLPDVEFLLQQIKPSTSSTCEVINVQPLHNLPFHRPKSELPTPGREMRSRQHLQYEMIKTFNDSNEFDQWWTQEGGSQGWIFNTIYKKKTEDEVHVYRCAHKNCSLRLRVVFVANSCDVRVEKALIEHMHEENVPKVDYVKTLSSEVKAKIALLENMGMTATKIRRSLFKDSVNEGNLPSLKQVQNYIARLRNKRSSPGNESPAPLSLTPSEIHPNTSNGSSTATGSVIPTNVTPLTFGDNGEIVRGQPRNSDKVEKIYSESTSPKVPVNNNGAEEDAEIDETEAVHKFSQLLESCQPIMKRHRLSYHFYRSFSTKEEYKEWWNSQRTDINYSTMAHNSTYGNNAGEQIDIYRCSKRDCHHRIRIVTNPNDGTVVVEKTDVAHDFAAHDAKTTLTREAKTLITELHDRGMKPKAIRTYFLQTTIKASEVPSITQIKNCVNRIKVKQKTETPMTSSGFSSNALKSAGAEVCDNRAIKEGSQSSEDQSSHGNDDSDTKRVLMKFQWV